MLRYQLTGGFCGFMISLQALPAAFDRLIEPTQAVDKLIAVAIR